MSSSCPNMSYDKLSRSWIQDLLYKNLSYQFHFHNWKLPLECSGKALWNGTQYFYFSRTMSNRITENGYWKDLDTEEPVFSEAGEIIGIKKYLNFHIGEAPAGQETNWVMQEYHLMSFHQLTNPRQVSANIPQKSWKLDRRLIYVRRTSRDSVCRTPCPREFH